MDPAHRPDTLVGTTSIRPSPGSLRKNGARSVEPNGSGPSQPMNKRCSDPEPVDGSRRKRGGTAAELVESAVLVDQVSPSRRERCTPRVRIQQLRRRRAVAELPRDRTRRARVLEGRRHVPGVDRQSRRCRGVRVLRRPALRQRPAALRPPAHRLRQGRGAALRDHARQAGAPPLRLGHPRTARPSSRPSASSASPTRARSRRWASPPSTRPASSRC